MEADLVFTVTGRQRYQEGIIFNVFAVTVIRGVGLKAIDGVVILFALVLARVVGGESTAEDS